MTLTDVQCKQAKPREKQYKLAAGGGLYLLVHPNGGRYWRWKFRWHGKEKLLAIGTYPETSLADAKGKRDDARKLLDTGQDPAAAKKQAKLTSRVSAANTFEAIAREWHGMQKGDWKPVHAEKVLRSLELNVFPHIGDRPVADITAPEILAVIREAEHRNALDVAGRILQRTSAVIRYAIVTGRASRNPANDLRGALKAPERQHRRYLPADELPDFLRALSEYPGEIVRLGMRLLIMTFVRPGELREAEWSELDLDAALWRIPAARMKMGEEHIVPLARQAVGVLRRLYELTGHRKHVFPSFHTPIKPMSDATLLRCIELLGYREQCVPHGFRTTASTWLNEAGFAPDLIERQLAHAPRDKVRAAYNRAQWLPERTKMMQTWADALVAMEAGKKVVPGKACRSCLTDAGRSPEEAERAGVGASSPS